MMMSICNDEHLEVNDPTERWDIFRDGEDILL
jgi:hypothetical protein